MLVQAEARSCFGQVYFPSLVRSRAGASSLRSAGAFQRPQRGNQKRQMLLTRALDPDNASVLICGGAGVGMHTTRKLKDMGAWVYMMQRSDKLRSEIEQMMAVCVKGDALDVESVAKVMKGVDDLDAVVSTIGGTVTNPKPDSEGNINLIEQAAQNGVKKFVLITSIGTGDSKDAPGEEVYNVLKPVLVEKAKAEQALMGQDKMKWVIIRPGGLTNDPASDNWFVTESRDVCGAISRMDVSSVVCKALFTDTLDNKVVAALDSEKVTTKVEYEAIAL